MIIQIKSPTNKEILDTLNTVIAEYDNEISRFEQGKDIKRSRKMHVTVNMEYRKAS